LGSVRQVLFAVSLARYGMPLAPNRVFRGIFIVPLFAVREKVLNCFFPFSGISPLQKMLVDGGCADAVQKRRKKFQKTLCI